MSVFGAFPRPVLDMVCNRRGTVTTNTAADLFSELATESYHTGKGQERAVEGSVHNSRHDDGGGNGPAA